MDTYVLFVFVLVALGFTVMVAEVMVPSLGLLSLMALGCFAGSTFFAWKAWYVTDQLVIWWSYVFSLLVAIPSAIIGLFYLLPRTAFGRRVMVIPPTPEEVRPYVAEETRLRTLVGKEAIAASMHSPGGMVRIGFEKLHSESEGVLIDAGTEVVVVGLKGNRLVVRPLSMHRATIDPEDDDPEDDDPEDDDPEDDDREDDHRDVGALKHTDDAVLAGDAQKAHPAAADSIDFDVPDAT